MNHMPIGRRAARGAIVGLFVPLVAFAIFFPLDKLNAHFLDYYITGWLIFPVAILEIPGVTIGRALGLPIETGGVAFLLTNLSAFGYALVVATWGAVEVQLIFGPNVV